MFGSKSTSSTGGEMRAMINEAEQILDEASTATGTKASELHAKGMRLLSSSISKAHEMERMAVSSAKDLAASTDRVVHANPWGSMAVSGLIGAGIGLALGIAVTRK